jgi:F-type H+-transporting ATPase subunit b
VRLLLGLFAPAHSLSPSLDSRALASSSNPPPPAERAAEIVDKLPSHPSLVTKTGTAILGSGLLAAAISHELYVFNEETVIAAGYLILFAYIAKVRRFFFSSLDSPSLPWLHVCGLG